MQGGTVVIIQPVARVERQEFHFSAVREVRRFVENEPSGFDRSLDGHAASVPLAGPPNKALYVPQSARVSANVCLVRPMGRSASIGTSP